MHFHRSMENTIEEVGKSFSCIVSYGFRQFGNSAMIEPIYGDTFQKVMLDDIDGRLPAQSNPCLFTETVTGLLSLMRYRGYIVCRMISVKWVKDGSSVRL